MNNKTIYCHYGQNRHVIDYYISVIVKSLELNGYEAKEVELKESGSLDKGNYILVVSALSLFKWYIKGFRNFIFWSQGAVPEESYMRNKSKTRSYILSLIEKFALKKSKFNFFVSNYQVKHYEKKYKLNLSDNSYIMPCYNSEIEKKSFFEKDKYSNSVFCYVGSLAPWQYFSETMDLYKRIEEENTDASLRVLTFSVDEATSIIQNKGIKNYSVEYVEQSQLSSKLAGCKYGFLLREDNIVNNVATPTKLSTYMSNGLIPIISESIYEYKKMLETKKYALILENDIQDNKIDFFNNLDIQADDVHDEFYAFFNQYFNTDSHIKKIARKLLRTI